MRTKPRTALATETLWVSEIKRSVPRNDLAELDKLRHGSKPGLPRAYLRICPSTSKFVSKSGGQRNHVRCRWDDHMEIAVELGVWRTDGRPHRGYRPPIRSTQVAPPAPRLLRSNLAASI